MNVHFFKLLQDHYFIITLYYCHVTTHYFLIITVLLLDYCKGTFHYFVIITYLLLLHYVSITTILLPDYYWITTIDCFIIPWSILWLITTWLLQLLPLLPIFITTLIPITTIITIIHPPNLEMIAFKQVSRYPWGQLTAPHCNQNAICPKMVMSRSVAVVPKRVEVKVRHR